MQFEINANIRFLTNTTGLDFGLHKGFELLAIEQRIDTGGLDVAIGIREGEHGERIAEEGLMHVLEISRQLEDAHLQKQ